MSEPTPSSGADVDIYLHALLDSILGFEDENHLNSMPISLVTAGGVITGSAHTHNTWVRGQIEDLKGADSEGANFLGRVLEIAEDGLTEKLAGDKDAEPFSRMRDSINLKGARVVNGGAVFEYAWLRVDIDQVLAWSLPTPAPAENG